MKKIVNNIIKNKIKNLEYMFYKCKLLKNIKESKYLDIKDINNFSYMFSECSALTNKKEVYQMELILVTCSLNVHHY